MTRDDLLTHDGITQPISEWALDYGIPPDMIIRRLEQGMSASKAITKPMKARRGQRLTGQYLVRELARLAKARSASNRGVVADLPDALGTGGGSDAQERPEIEFSEIEASR